MTPTKLFSSLAILAALNACDSGLSSEDFGGRSGQAKGMLTLSITDSALEDIKEVWVEFSEIELKPAEGPSFTITFDQAKKINLLDLQGSLSQDLFADELVVAGDYNWVRLGLNAIQDSTMDSYLVMKNGAMPELDIPSGSQTGLKINTAFSVDAYGSTSMTIDFDLRKSIVMSNGEYKLKPVLRLVNNAESNHIKGSISSDMTVGANCSDDIPETGQAVYVFEGADVVADDIDNQDPNPIASSLLTLNTNTGDYDYEVGFLPAGVYTVSYTCMADLDDPEVDDNIIFSSLGNVVVDAPADTGGAEMNR